MDIFVSSVLKNIYIKREKREKKKDVEKDLESSMARDY